MRVAVITGASSGIGKDFALMLSQLNLADEFWLIARRKEHLEDLAHRITQKCTVITADLSEKQGLEKYGNLLKEEKPDIKYLVNAAGYGKYGSYETVNTEMAFNMIDLNVKAVVFISQKSIPYMKNGSHIIQMGSASTYNPLPNLNIYASTKSFVRHYSRALSFELKPKGISVTTVCPGWVKTEFFDRAKIDTDSPKSFAKPVVQSKDVVKKAILDANKGRDISMYGWYNNLHFALSKLLPHKVLIRTWLNMQKN